MALWAGVIVVVSLHPTAAWATAPSVSVTPAGPFSDGQRVTVSVGPNSVFTPNARVNILECADPGGSPANLPRDDSTCDGNTIQGNSLLVHSDGSFSEQNYTLYQLPSSTLGEQANFQPACNASTACVLFVGQDQNDFTAPKVFSAPFYVNPASGGSTTTTAGAAAGTTSSGGGSAPGTTASSATSNGTGSAGPAPMPSTGTSAHLSAPGGAAAGSAPPTGPGGVLAFTGAPAWLWSLALTGAVLAGAGGLALVVASRRGWRGRVAP